MKALRAAACAFWGRCLADWTRGVAASSAAIFGVGRWQQVTPHREHLSELEKNQPEFLEGFPYVLRGGPLSFYEWGAQEFVSDEHAQDLRYSRHRAPHAALLRADHCSYVPIPTIIRGTIRDAVFWPLSGCVELHDRCHPRSRPRAASAPERLDQRWAITFSSLDRAVGPHTGKDFNVALQVAGVGGNVKYYSPQLSYRQFFPMKGLRINRRLFPR